jgi:coenzyme F420-reducing hydrogenase beta subunit
MSSKHLEIYDKSNCMGCTACSSICPKSCIQMSADKEGFSYPVVDLSKCIECGKCVKVCPMLNPLKPREDSEFAAYAAVSNNKNILEDSSSGGVFYYLGLQVLKQGGVVYGAKFTDEFMVSHSKATTQEELKAFMGSKYIQSNIGYSLKDIKKELDSNYWVLFSGTPCQIAGLKKYLNHDYEKLILCDFICTGVGSPKFFSYYLDYFANKFGEPIRTVSFRNKKHSWEYFQMVIKSKKHSYEKIRFFDPFIKAFYSHKILRPSCYNCKYKRMNSGADIKLGDYWSVQSVHPNIANPMGVSLILIGSNKGDSLLKSVQDKLEITPTAYENVLLLNKSYSEVVKKPEDREDFFQILAENPSPEMVFKRLKKLTKTSLKDKILVYLRFLKHWTKNIATRS